MIIYVLGPVHASVPAFHVSTDGRVLNATQELADEFPFNRDMNSGDPIGIGWTPCTVSFHVSHLSMSCMDPPNRIHLLFIRPRFFCRLQAVSVKAVLSLTSRLSSTLVPILTSLSTRMRRKFCRRAQVAGYLSSKACNCRSLVLVSISSSVASLIQVM